MFYKSKKSNMVRKNFISNISFLIILFSFLFIFSNQQALAATSVSTKKQEILSIKPPTIIYANSSVIAGEGPIIVVGTTATNTRVVAHLLDAQNQIVVGKTMSTDSNGNWSVSFNDDIGIGDYQLSVVALDENMSSSSATVSDIIKVRPRPTLVLGDFEINLTWFFIGLILLMLVSFILGWSSYENWLEQLDRKVIIAKRDVNNVFNNIDDDIEELLKNYTNKNTEACDFSKIKTILKNIKVNLEKSRHYVVDNIKEIEK